MRRSPTLEIVWKQTKQLVRWDAEEHAAEKHPGWKRKNIRAWTKNVMFCEILAYNHLHCTR